MRIVSNECLDRRFERWTVQVESLVATDRVHGGIVGGDVNGEGSEHSPFDEKAAEVLEY